MLAGKIRNWACYLSRYQGVDSRIKLSLTYDSDGWVYTRVLTRLAMCDFWALTNSWAQILNSRYWSWQYSSHEQPLPKQNIRRTLFTILTMQIMSVTSPAVKARQDGDQGRSSSLWPLWVRALTGLHHLDLQKQLFSILFLYLAFKGFWPTFSFSHTLNVIAFKKEICHGEKWFSDEFLVLNNKVLNTGGNDKNKSLKHKVTKSK
jgi:hypothetical protein